MANHSIRIFIVIAKILLSLFEEDITKIHICKMVILSAKERLKYFYFFAQCLNNYFGFDPAYHA